MQDEFVIAYLECALWSSLDDNGEPMDQSYSVDDLAPETVEAAIADCREFVAQNKCELDESGLLAEDAGFSFWLSRNGHGAGFFTCSGPESVLADLQRAARGFGACDFYSGDDGRIYSS